MEASYNVLSVGPVALTEGIFSTPSLISLPASQVPDILGGTCKCGSGGRLGCLEKDSGVWNDPEVMKVGSTSSAMET